jgi:protein-S-isoprenylcysteine O-methyltransferase Ste14
MMSNAVKDAASYTVLSLPHKWIKVSHMDIFGIGPRIAVSGALSLAASLIVSFNRQPFGYWFIPDAIRVGLGTALVVAGIYFWLASVWLIITRLKSGVLITIGVYRIVRNPMYAGFIVFIVPGISLILNNPLIILSSLVMMLVFSMSIHKEEKYLKQQFAAAYQEYMLKVKQIIPFIW